MNSNQLKQCAEALEEVAAVLEQLSVKFPEVFDELNVRYPLVDELGGYKGMLRDHAQGIESPMTAVSSESPRLGSAFVTSFMTDGERYFIRVPADPTPIFYIIDSEGRLSSTLNQQREALREVSDNDVPMDFRWLLHGCVREWRDVERAWMRKRSALKVLAQIGFSDCEDDEVPGIISHIETGVSLNCLTSGPADVIRLAVDHGKQAGRQEVRSQMRAALGI